MWGAGERVALMNPYYTPWGYRTSVVSRDNGTNRSSSQTPSMYTPYGPPRELTIRPAGGAVRHFLLHIGEMVLAMFVGMALFGSLFSAILVAAGTTYTEALEAVPELIALALMVEMTVPMVLSMRHRGHCTARVAEMAGACSVSPLRPSCCCGPPSSRARRCAASSVPSCCRP